MSTFIIPKDESEYFIDREGRLTYVQHEEATRAYTLDWSDQLNTGETISTSTWDEEGVSVDSSSNTTTTTTATISQTNGAAKNTITTSAGRTEIKRIFFVAPVHDEAVDDYGRF